MKIINSPFFGLTFEGEISSNEMILKSVEHTTYQEHCNPIECNIHATIGLDNLVRFELEGEEVIAVDMVEALIVISSYYLTKLAYTLKDNIKLKCAIDELTY